MKMSFIDWIKHWSKKEKKKYFIHLSKDRVFLIGKVSKYMYKYISRD